MDSILTGGRRFSLWICITICISILCTRMEATEDVGVPVLNVVVLNAASVNISWTESLWSDWNISGLNDSFYYVQVRENETSAWQDYFQTDTKDPSTWIIASPLKPYTYYQFRVLVDEDHALESEWVRTDMDVPSGHPVIVNESIHYNAYSMEFEFKPLPVSEWNGELSGYTLSYTNHASNETKKSVIYYSADKQKVPINDLKPFTNYTVRLCASNDAGDGPFAEFSFRTEEDVPSAPRITKILSRNSTALWFRWEPPHFANGVLLGYIVYVQCNQTVMTFNVTDTNLYHITGLLPYTAYDLQVSGYTKMGEGALSGVYPVMTDVTAPGAPNEVNVTSNQTDTVIVRWLAPQTFSNRVDRYWIVYRIANETLEYRKVVDGAGSVHEEPLFSLHPNTLYRVKVAAATKSIVIQEYYYIGPYSEEKEVQTLAVYEDNWSSAAIGIVAGIACTVAVLLIVVVFILIRRCMQIHYQFISDQDIVIGEKSSTAEKLTLAPLYDAHSCSHRDAIGVDKFEEHVAALHADGDYLLSQEYDEINRQTPSSSLTLQSLADDNKHKNRYLNILAYDHSRVVLKQVQNKPRSSDYINANHIDGYLKPKAYIATQGPLPSTFGDFWRMVWEQESVIIVMITNLMEKGRRKCDQYWPTEGEQLYDGGLLVHLLSTSVTAHYTVRMFSLRYFSKTLKKRCSSLVAGNTNSICERIIYQYHYTDWPDHGVPAYTLPSLAFVAKSAAANPPSAGPIIVHCSAGVGRTGTYIVLDSMMRQIKDIQTVNVYGFLSHIRNQRSYVVQTEDQYSFIHDALVEFIRSGGETEVKDISLSQYVRQLTTVDDAGNTGLRTQYQLINTFEVKQFHFQSALASVNAGKNRSTTILPVELSRVHLPAKAGVEGSDYINASFLQGYTRNDEFIVTQHPVDNTVADFWNMIWDQNSVTIVLLSPVDETDWKVFWPQKDDADMDFGNFHVVFQKQTDDAVYSSVEFLLQSTQDDYECVVRMVQCSCWPSSFSPLRTVFELINKVKAWHAEQAQGPVIVVDKFGGVEAATFCALMTLYDALHHEASIDVYTVAKLYCMKRPHIFPTEEDYLFLYRAVESLCNEDEACVSGDRDSGIANCNNYSVETHQPPSSPCQQQPSSPKSPASVLAEPLLVSPGSPKPQPESPSSSSPLHSKLLQQESSHHLAAAASPSSPQSPDKSCVSSPSLEQHAVVSIL